jgi:hypothetical protein
MNTTQNQSRLTFSISFIKTALLILAIVGIMGAVFFWSPSL